VAEAEHPSFINLPEFPANNDFAINLPAFPDGFRAQGGPVDQGGGYVVGERGPEIFHSSSRSSSSSSSSRELLKSSDTRSHDSIESMLREHFGTNGNTWVPKAFDGFRAAGGPVTSGSHYMVGERGPEIFRPSQDGEIIPNHLLNSFNSFNSLAATAIPPMPEIAGFMAEGGDVFEGNSYLVGERGREVYRVPGVSNVANSVNNSRRGGDVHHNNITQNNYGDKQGGDLMGRTARQELARLFRK
jgi:hypothetical protein